MLYGQCCWLRMVVRGAAIAMWVIYVPVPARLQVLHVLQVIPVHTGNVGAPAELRWFLFAKSHMFLKRPLLVQLKVLKTEVLTYRQEVHLADGLSVKSLIQVMGCV